MNKIERSALLSPTTMESFLFMLPELLDKSVSAFLKVHSACITFNANKVGLFNGPMLKEFTEVKANLLKVLDCGVVVAESILAREQHQGKHAKLKPTYSKVAARKRAARITAVRKRTMVSKR